MKLTNITLSTLALGATLLLGCATQPEAGDDNNDDAELTGQTSQAETQRYCVDQSSARIFRYTDPDQLWISCHSGSGGIPWNDTIYSGHPVHITDECTTGPYVEVKDLWSSSSWVMRRDALSPC